MRTSLSWYLGFVWFCLSSTAFAGIPSSAPHVLPQAQPGASYSAQLSIPPGLGYPFASCKLTGDTLPMGLSFDCDRLQLKGHVALGIEKTYNVTLQLQDAQGNQKSFPLSLRVSAKPEVVDLSTPELADATAQASVLAATSPKSVPAHSTDPVPPAHPVNVSATRANPVTGGNLILKEAVVHPAHTSEASAPATRPAEAAANAGDQNLSDSSSQANATCSDVKIGATVPDEDGAQDALVKAQKSFATADADANCATAAKALNEGSCKDYPGTLSALKDQARKASVLLNDCTLNGTVLPGAQTWYSQRALAWQKLASTINDAKIKDPAKGEITAPPSDSLLIWFPN